MRFHLSSMLFVLLLNFIGCSSSGPTPPPHNRRYMTPEGHFVGHLKPEDPDGIYGPPTDPHGKPIVAVDPVKWVVIDGQVHKPKYEIDVQAFRVDFDEQQPITEAILPFAFMTDEGEVAVFRGDPGPAPISNPKIAAGAPLLPIFSCVNFEACPRAKELGKPFLFPYSGSGSEDNPPCPHCQQTKTEALVIPQQRDIRDYIQMHKNDRK